MSSPAQPRSGTPGPLRRRPLAGRWWLPCVFALRWLAGRWLRCVFALRPLAGRWWLRCVSALRPRAVRAWLLS